MKTVGAFITKYLKNATELLEEFDDTETISAKFNIGKFEIDVSIKERK